uniref:PUM-HD domain-containing protein n=1 Tax=Globodera pallida TaxID=36090 RepID=A0A183CQF9_GLOPA
LHENVLTLVTDKYGCFVIEHVVEHGRPEDRERIVRSLQGDVLKYAQHKFASNVIKNNGSGSPPLLQMMKHPFANDVVHKMMDAADSAHRQKMLLAIEEHIPALLQRHQ